MNDGKVDSTTVATTVTVSSANVAPVAILNHNKPAAYLISAAAYEDMLEQLEDAALTKTAQARAGGPTVKVKLEDL